MLNHSLIVYSTSLDYDGIIGIVIAGRRDVGERSDGQYGLSSSKLDDTFSLFVTTSFIRPRMKLYSEYGDVDRTVYDLSLS